MRNYFACLTAVLITAASVIPSAAAAEPTAQFSDVSPDAWYAEAVEYVRNHGIMNGTSATIFNPNGTASRGQIAAILYRASGSPEISGGTDFTDVVDTAYYADAVRWASTYGIVTGYGDGTFRPNNPITRQQLAAILWRYAGSPVAESSVDYADEADISAYADTAVDWARDTGIISGRDGNRFDPNGRATRAQAAVILYRYDTWEPPTPEIPDSEPAPEPEPPPEPEPEPPLEENPSGTLRPNTYDRNAFVVENGFLTYQGGTSSYVGVDVSSHQDWIDWNRVAAAGVDFAMIRVGYRGYTAGRINPDPYWDHNITGALAAGLDVGIYFYSQATSVEEALEEADWTLERIAGYGITYPVVFDWERVSGPYSRTSTTSAATVTACAQAFCERIEAVGYTAMTYGNPTAVGRDIDLEELTDYPFWLAHYTTGWRPSSFRYHYDMWQYTSSGTVDGINGRVDLNICLTDWT